MLTERGDVAPSERLSTLVAQQVESAEIVRLAQRDLSTRPVRRVDREELCRDDLVAVLYRCRQVERDETKETMSIHHETLRVQSSEISIEEML